MISGNSNTLLQVALYYNAGVGYLEKADNHSATRCFKAALARIQLCLQEEAAAHKQPVGREPESDKAVSMPLYSTRIPGLEDEAFYVFDHAWILSTSMLNGMATPARGILESLQTQNDPVGPMFDSLLGNNPSQMCCHQNIH